MDAQQPCQSYKLRQKRRNTRVVFMQSLYIHYQLSLDVQIAFADALALAPQGQMIDKDFLQTLVAFFEAYKNQLEQSLSQELRYDISQFSLIDQSLLLSALCELNACRLTDKAIVINEFLEIAKEYSEPCSAKKIHPLLDKVQLLDLASQS